MYRASPQSYVSRSWTTRVAHLDPASSRSLACESRIDTLSAQRRHAIHGGEACDELACCVAAPTRVIEAGASAITAGHGYSCAVVRGQVQCWGNDTYTLIPDRDLTGCPDACEARCLSEPTPLPTAEQVSRFSGSRRLLCGAGPRGVYCWGADSAAGLQVSNSHIPNVSIDEQPIPDWIDLPALDVAVTDLQTVCVLREDQEVVCWRRSYDSRGIARERPEPLEGASDVVQIQAGLNGVCGVKSDHSLRCWGAGDTPSKWEPHSISLSVAIN